MEQEYLALRESYVANLQEKEYKSLRQTLLKLTKLNRSSISKDFEESLFEINIKLLTDAFIKSEKLHRHFFVFIELLKKIDKKNITKK